MNEALKKFIEMLAKDSALQEKMVNCKSEEEAYAIAREKVEGFSKEEFQSAMADIQKGYSTDTELTEGDLEEVSGGISTPSWVAIGIGIAAPCAAAAM